MRWELDHGARYRETAPDGGPSTLRLMEKEGKDIGRIEVYSLVRPFFDGFWELCSDRTTSGFGGMSGIPYPSKVAWLNVNADPMVWKFGLFCFRVLDAEYMSYMAARAEAESKKSKSKKR